MKGLYVGRRGLGTRNLYVYIVETSGVYPDPKIQSLKSDPIDLDTLPSQQVLCPVIQTP
ncbi:hypothetical protein POX_f07395 [Penicillium oxalicum]|uniref:hypothetical protein n=1 Tax=Penicillium oxalicum TaxID=69781 RepID=UPI0020B83C85|nr:hypothetical protein POX_f07395 [Penicillium oxalicum]KAI2787040.1 hypothetical protein POX_f07395 [Penicillium oxalicum]